jgi:hypothetical protein
MAVKISGLNLLRSNFYAGINVVQKKSDYSVYVKEIRTVSLGKTKSQQNKNQSSIFQTVSPAYELVRKESDNQRV